MNLHLIACFLLGMSPSFSVSFFFSDYVHPPSVLHA